MNRQNNHFDEYNHFKSVIKDPKHREIPSLEGISVTFKDPESWLDFNVPVNMIKEVSERIHPLGFVVTEIRLLTGEVYPIVGSMSEALRKITEVKIKGVHHADI